MDFILCPTDKYMFRVKNKNKLINLLNLLKVKSKHGMTSFRCIYGWPWPQSTYQHSASTFNFKEAFVSSVRKTSHNVLQKQKARYLYVNKNWKAYFIQRFIIHRIEISNEHLIFDNTSALNLLYESEVIIVSSRYLICWIFRCWIIWSQNFFCCIKPKTYLNHWNSETNWQVFNSLHYNGVL